MAKALRSDLVDSPRWAGFVQTALSYGDALYPQKCPNCDVEYTILLVVMEDLEPIVKLLREHLPKECPEHQPEIYRINEGPQTGQVLPGISN